MIRTMSVLRYPAYCVVLSAAVFSSTARAHEGITPYLPGVTTTVPLGALPEPGIYLSNTTYASFGDAVDGDGNELPIKVANYADAATLVWSTPFELLGARYGASVTQIVASHGVDARGIGGRRTRSIGTFNTIIQPVILSWPVNDKLFVSLGQTFYLNNGSYKDRAGVRDQDSYANNYWTYEPNVAVSYLSKTYQLTANVVYDVSTQNKSTKYRSGDVVYVDLSAIRQLGRFGVGAVANITQQVDDDRRNGIVVGDGNRVSHVMAGPAFTFNLGKVTAKARYLANIRSRNDINLSVAFLTLSTKL